MKYLPNTLTILRLLSCPILIYLFYTAPPVNEGAILRSLYLDETLRVWFILTIFVLACLTDFFDGYIARKKNLESNLGKVLDPIADKALIITISILLIVYSNIAKLPLYLIIFREIIVLSLRYDLSNVEKSINVNLLSKTKTVIQMVAIISVFFYFLYSPSSIYTISWLLLWFAAFITIISGIQHLKTYLYLRKK